MTLEHACDFPKKDKIFQNLGKNVQNWKIFWRRETSYACDYRMHEASGICPGLSNNSQNQIYVAFLVGNEFNYQRETLNFSTACLMPVYFICICMNLLLV